MFALLIALAFAQEADAKPDAADVDAPDVEQMAEDVHDLAEEIRALTAEIRALPKHEDTGILPELPVDDSCSMDEAGPVEEPAPDADDAD